MQLAAGQTHTDLIAIWQATHGVAWCQRMSATISHATCEENKRRSVNKYGDLRCQGCGGLDNQNESQELKTVCTWNTEELSATRPDAAPGSASATAENDPFAALDNIIDQLYEDPMPGDDFDDVELDLTDDELLQLFPEFAEDTPSDFPRFKEYQTAAPRRAVYRGRCTKCGGYMEDTRERHDNNVFAVSHAGGALHRNTSATELRTQQGE